MGRITRYNARAPCERAALPACRVCFLVQLLMNDKQEPIGVGFFGCGTVGSGTIATLLRQRDSIERLLGRPLSIETVCVRRPGIDRGLDLPASRFTDDPEELLNNPRVRIVVEVIGGVEPARDFIARSLASGRQVVTANKELIAREGAALLRLAAENRADLFFEGSVAGAIPVVRALKVSLAADRINQIIGIVNGTTNFILTRMSAAGCSFEEALAEAQERGYAEADPSADVDGYDAASKLSILGSIAFQSRAPVAQVHREGIRAITSRDIEYARALGYSIKLVAIGKRTDAGLDLRVHPVMLPQTHPLAGVNDVFNAVFVTAESAGELMFYGRGAGSLPTGSAVAADIVEAARGLVFGGSGRVACTCFAETPLVPVEQVRANYYIRTSTDDRPGVIAAIAAVFGRHGVSLESILQKASHEDEAEIVWITHETTEGVLRTALAEIEQLPVVRGVRGCIRVEE